MNIFDIIHIIVLSIIIYQLIRYEYNGILNTDKLLKEITDMKNSVNGFGSVFSSRQIYNLYQIDIKCFLYLLVLSITIKYTVLIGIIIVLLIFNPAIMYLGEVLDRGSLGIDKQYKIIGYSNWAKWYIKVDNSICILIYILIFLLEILKIVIPPEIQTGSFHIV